MNNILKNFQYLMWYPDKDFFHHLDSLERKISNLNDEELDNEMSKIKISFNEFSLTKLEELYSQSFDWNVTHSLYIGYYLFGETYFRSNFLSNLLDIFKRFNYRSTISDLPDHLAILLDFTASCLKENEQREFIDSILITGLDKLLNISLHQIGKNNSSFTMRNPFFLLLSFLFKFLTSYISKEIIITTI